MRHLNLVVFVLMVILVCKSGFAQEGFCPVEVPGKAFCDDFSDMTYDDGSPVTWMPGAFANAVLDASSGDLVVTHNGLSSTFVDVDLSDVVIRTQLKFTEGGGLAGVWGRDAIGTDSIIASINSEGSIRLQSLVSGSATIRGEFDTGLDPTTQYVNLQLSLIGRQYGLTAWAEGEQRPDSQVVWDDINSEFPHLNGSLGIWQDNSMTQSTTYRFYEAVPEPSSAVLLAIGAVGLFGHRLRRKKLSAI